jgi:hypothetical protein
MDAPQIEVPHIEERRFPADHGIGDQLAFAAQYAQLAPSSHNSQPWRIGIDGNCVQIKADRMCALPYVDPFDRELAISCGAALFHLRVALAHFGHDVVVDVTPDSADPDVLAVIASIGRKPPSADSERLFRAIPSRHTNRGPYAPRPLSAALVHALAKIVQGEGASLFVADDERKDQLGSLIADADHQQMADPRFRRELALWIDPNRAATFDGMPAYAQRLAELRTSNAVLALRTFDTREYRAARDRDIAVGSPTLIVLGTAGDDEADWVRAGEALDHVLLRCASEGVAASFLNQPIEVPALRERVAQIVEQPNPQVVLRLGYPLAEATPTARRSYHEMVRRGLG